MFISSSCTISDCWHSSRRSQPWSSVAIKPVRIFNYFSDILTTRRSTYNFVSSRSGADHMYRHLLTSPTLQTVTSCTIFVRPWIVIFKCCGNFDYHSYCDTGHSARKLFSKPSSHSIAGVLGKWKFIRTDNHSPYELLLRSEPYYGEEETWQHYFITFRLFNLSSAPYHVVTPLIVKVDCQWLKGILISFFFKNYDLVLMVTAIKNMQISSTCLKI